MVGGTVPLDGWRIVGISDYPVLRDRRFVPPITTVIAASSSGSGSRYVPCRFISSGAYQGESSTAFDDDAGAAYTELYGADGGFQGEVDSYVDDQ